MYINFLNNNRTYRQDDLIEAINDNAACLDELNFTIQQLKSLVSDLENENYTLQTEIDKLNYHLYELEQKDV